MNYYETCPKCGAHLDPGEKCDCEDTVEPKFHSVKELAARWSCSPDLVRDLIRRGDLPVLRIGRTIRIPTNQIESYEARNTAAARPAAVKGRNAPVLRL